jgi:CheY-like chemotaxis protein
MSRAAYDVLLVDDEAVVGAAARRILSAEGLTVDVVAEAAAAIERAGSNDYGLVLCDLKLPGVRGLELVRRLRELCGETPLVTITGYATTDNAVEGLAHGIFDFIPKPFDVGELLGVVQRGLAYARAGRLRAEPDPADADGTVYCLGSHAWVVLDRAGRARIGMGATFAPLTEPLAAVELAAPGEQLLQGGRCVRLVTASEHVHRLWAPLSGQVVETNERGLGGLTARPPGALCRSWLITMLPTHPERELSRLSRRVPSGAERG